jgi:hypothetical protein
VKEIRDGVKKECKKLTPSHSCFKKLTLSSLFVHSRSREYLASTRIEAHLLPRLARVVLSMSSVQTLRSMISGSDRTLACDAALLRFLAILPTNNETRRFFIVKIKILFKIYSFQKKWFFISKYFYYVK